MNDNEKPNEDPSKEEGTEKDITKDAFFSDLSDMESEIAEEAYSLVEHAMSLLQTGYYDDAIEIMRQAIGQYEMINYTEEMEALNNKIAEIYVMKEQAFTTEVVEETPETTAPEIGYTAEDLLTEASQLVEIEEIEEAVERYKEALRLYADQGNEEGIEKVNQLIAECQATPQEEVPIKDAETPAEESTEAPVQELPESEKKRLEEEQKSLKAYELMEQGAVLMEEKRFEAAIELYENALKIFKEINWEYEIHKVQATIAEADQKQTQREKQVEQERVRLEEERAKRFEETEKLNRAKQKREDLESQAREKKVKAFERQKEEEAKFQQELEALVNKATNLAREYEKASLEEKLKRSCPHEEVHQIYETLAEMVKQKGWEEESKNYSKQAHIYKEKAEEDEKMRQAEYEKLEEQEFYENMEQRTSALDKRAREYEVEFKRGMFDKKCPYEDIIRGYEEIKQVFQEKGDATQVTIAQNQINTYKAKWEKDKKIRALEEEKARKNEAFDAMMKAQVDGQQQKMEEKIEKKEDTKEGERQVADRIMKLTDDAEKKAREYEKQIKKGKFDLECPYPEIIGIYEEVKSLVIEEGWTDKISLYANQIQVYKTKLEKDKRLREIEAEKLKKQQEYDELYKSSKVDSRQASEREKRKKVQESVQLESEKEHFDEQMEALTRDAERMAREYEHAIRKGKFDEECPYDQIIQTYKKVRDAYGGRGDETQVAIAQNQINVYKSKLEKDKKLREIEAEKVLKQKEYEETYKMSRPDTMSSAETKRIESIEEKRRKEEQFEDWIDNMIAEADKLEREYSRQIKKGNFELDPPYAEIINIYEDIKIKVKEKGWKEEVHLYALQINDYQAKAEKDKRLREIEAQKTEKDKDYQEMLKSGKARQQEKVEKMSAIEEKRRAEEEFEDWIDTKISEADQLEREYERQIKKGHFEVDPPYAKIIDIYTIIKDKVKEKGWADQVHVYANQITAYQAKGEKDKKLREIEAQKAEKDKYYKQMLKGSKDKQPEKMQRLMELEQQKKEEEQLSDEALSLIDEAERMGKEYETKLQVSKEILFLESPYEEIIEKYKNARKLFNEAGWKEESAKLINTIKFYMQKQSKDQRLRELERTKRDSEEEVVATPGSKWKEKQQQQIEKMARLEEKAKGKGDEIDTILSPLDAAEQEVKEYEHRIKTGNILELESPYGKIIEQYRSVKKELQEAGYEEQAAQLNDSINFYKGKAEKDAKLREIEAAKLGKEEAFHELMKSTPKAPSISREAKIQDLDEAKSKEDHLSEEAFAIIDEAEKLAKDYELKRRSGAWPDCPYENVIDMYREARGMLEEIGWAEQASQMVGSINHYKAKLKKDQRLRVFEEEKARKEAELLEKQKKSAKDLTEKDREELKKREEALKEKQAGLSEEEKKREEAFQCMDRAKLEFGRNNFEEAIELYRESKKMFEEIEWNEGISMVNQSIAMIKKKQKEFEIRQQSLQEKEKKRLELERRLDEKLQKVAELKKEDQKRKRQEMVELEHQKAEEKKRSEEAYSLLERGTYLLKKNDFDLAEEKYMAARKIFRELNWAHEVSRINSDLLMKLQREKSKVKRLEEHKEKKEREKKELETLLQKAEQQHQQQQELNKRAKRQKLVDLQQTGSESNRMMAKLDEARDLIDDVKYNQALLKLNEIKTEMEELGWTQEIVKVNEQIYEIKRTTEVPLIALSELEKGENVEAFNEACKVLDGAQLSISRGLLMKASSQLSEAKHRLAETKIGNEFEDEIEMLIQQLRDKIKGRREKKAVSDIEGMESSKSEELSSDLAYKYMDKASAEERKNNYAKAIKFATTAKSIFEKLGAEWNREISAVSQHVAVLQRKHQARQQLFKLAQEEQKEEEKGATSREEELKERIKARRAARRKKIRENLESDDDKE